MAKEQQESLVIRSPMHWLCRVGLHRWGNWRKPFCFGASLYQNAQCLRCGKGRQRDIGVCPAD